MNNIYILKNANVKTIVNCEVAQKIDIMVEYGKISKIGINQQQTGTKVFDYSGRYIIPGLCEIHSQNGVLL